MACGVLGMGGNKGAVAVSFSLHRRRIAFVCSHFAAHQVSPCCCLACLPVPPISDCTLSVALIGAWERLMIPPMRACIWHLCACVCSADLRKVLPARLTGLACWVQNMVEARNANYMTIVRHLSFAKRGAANVDDVEAQGSGKSEKQHSAAETYDNGSDSDTEAPEPRLLRVRVPASAYMLSQHQYQCATSVSRYKYNECLWPRECIQRLALLAYALLLAPERAIQCVTHWNTAIPTIVHNPSACFCRDSKLIIWIKLRIPWFLR